MQKGGKQGQKKNAKNLEKSQNNLGIFQSGKYFLHPIGSKFPLWFAIFHRP